MSEPVLTIELAQPQEWLSLNKRYHWSRRSTLTRYWRQMAAAAAPKARHGQEWPLPRCRVQVTYVVPDRRRRDVTNWSLTSKALVDGLVDCGVWPDDHAGYVVGPDERLEIQPGKRAIRIDVYDLTEGEQA